MSSSPVSTHPTHPMQPIGQPSKAAFAVIGAILIGTGSVYGLDRTESWRHHLQPRVPFFLDVADPLLASVERPDVRTAAEHIENIRKVFNPSVAELADVFNVSRQAIYKWLSGSSTPEEEKLGRILVLSRITDAFQAAGVTRAGDLLKMKTFGGCSLMDLIKSGEYLDEHVVALITEAKAMESSYRESGLTMTKSKPTSDWQSSISIPGSPEQF